MGDSLLAVEKQRRFFVDNLMLGVQLAKFVWVALQSLDADDASQHMH